MPAPPPPNHHRHQITTATKSPPPPNEETAVLAITGVIRTNCISIMVSSADMMRCYIIFIIGF